MIKTAQQIENDVYTLLSSSNIVSSISGGIYMSEKRPKDSMMEDIIVEHPTVMANQEQIGIININTYIPDYLDNGMWNKDTERCSELEPLLQELIDTLFYDCTEYDFTLDKAITIFNEEPIHQHFINVRLHFRRITN